MAHFLPMAVRFAMVDIVFNDPRYNKTFVSKFTPQKLLEVREEEKRREEKRKKRRERREEKRREPNYTTKPLEIR